MALANEYGADSLRYFLVSEIPFGEDGDFSAEALVARNNGELVNNLGNLANRILTFIHSKNAGKIPKPSKYDALDAQVEKKIAEHADRAASLMDGFNLQGALDELMKLSKFGNEYFQAKEPWKGNHESCLYLGANLLRSLAITLSPFIPQSAEKMWGYLNLEGSVHGQKWESAKEMKIKGGHVIKKPEPLFRKFRL